MIFFGGFAFVLFLGLHLSERIENERLLARRIDLLHLKKKQLSRLAETKRAWLSQAETTSPEEIAMELSELRLCEAVFEKLMYNAYHPFLKDAKGVETLLDELDQNAIVLKKVQGDYVLVKPVYMEEKDLEKMIEIIENKGAFSPVEIKELDFKRKSLLGGELWRIERLVFGSIAGGAS